MKADDERIFAFTDDCGKDFSHRIFIFTLTPYRTRGYTAAWKWSSEP